MTKEVTNKKERREANLLKGQRMKVQESPGEGGIQNSRLIRIRIHAPGLEAHRGF